MKLTSEIKQTPTYRQYVVSDEFTLGSTHEVQLVLCNPDWKSITFFAEAFKVSFKYRDSSEYARQVKAVSKVINKPCKCFLEAESKTLANVELNPASDADESFMEFNSTERGWERSR